jgi:hypothetical protein
MADNGTVMSVFPDIQSLQDRFAEAARDGEALVAGLSEQLALWRPSSESWSVAECFDHLATTNRVYLEAMRPSALRAREQKRERRGPARPGILGRWFARSMEPPVKPRFKMKAPRSIHPRSTQSPKEIYDGFVDSHNAVQEFLRENANLDLAGVTFPNPFIKSFRFSLATGLHVLAAHERRHIWQGWRVREAAERG